MLHELIDFLLFGSILLCHSEHKLLHLGDIGLGDCTRFVATRLLPRDVNDAVGVGACPAVKKHCAAHHQCRACRRFPQPACAAVLLCQRFADALKRYRTENTAMSTALEGAGFAAGKNGDMNTALSYAAD